VNETILDGFRWVFTADHWWGSNGILQALGDHVRYSAIGLLIAAAIGLPIGLYVGHTGRGRFVSTGVATALRALPTIGVVMLLFRWRPISIWPVLGALVVLAIPPIVLNTAAGIDAVDRDARDAAQGLGLSPWQVLFQVEVPCALPLVLAGLRSAANQVIATATIAGFGIGLGGLGTFLFSGFGTQVYEKVYGGTILVVALVLLVEVLFALLQRRIVSPGVRARRSHTAFRAAKGTL
jgi:osmoprotectant transport system permease protein